MLPSGVALRSILTGAARIARNPFDAQGVQVVFDALLKTGLYQLPYERALSRLTPDERDQLEHITKTPIPWRDLPAYPERSLGRLYYDWMVEAELDFDFYNHLSHFRDWRILRGGKLHDLLHTLFGVGRSAVEESFIQAFNATNLLEPGGLATLAAWPLMARRYGEPARFARTVARGAYYGYQTPTVYTFPLELHLATDVAALRDRLGLPTDGFRL
jgi:ubiquinone biosynthesis protein Coq4